jgi:hypothetical protein
MAESLHDKLKNSFASIEKFKLENKPKQSPKKKQTQTDDNQMMVKFKQGF